MTLNKGLRFLGVCKGGGIFVIFFCCFMFQENVVLYDFKIEKGGNFEWHPRIIY